MTFSDYLKHTWVELLLCVLCAAAMGLQVVQCFHIADQTAENVLLVAALTAIPTIAFFIAAFNRRTAAVGIPLLIVLAVASCAVLSTQTPTALFADSYENPALVWLVLLPTSLVLFLLTRKRAGIVVAFIAGGILCGAVQFLYLKALIVPTIVFVVACAALFLLKNAAGARTADDILLAQTGKLGMSLGLCACAALLAAGVFMLLIQPFNPPAHELKLITEYYSLEEVHVTGLTDWLHQLNEETTSKYQNDQQRETSNTNNQQQEAQGNSAQQQNGDDDQLSGGSMLPNAMGAAASVIRYFQEHPWMILLLLLLLALLWIAVVAIRRMLRKRKFGAWQQLPASIEAAELYAYTCGSLEKARLLSRGALTPLELAVSAQAQTDQIEKDNASCTFGQLTSTYVRSAYGASTPSTDELGSLRQYAAQVPKRVMHAVGRLRYLRLFFRI